MFDEMLSKLGLTADDIAAKLLELGYKGKLHSRCECPIALLISRHGFMLVDVRRKGVTYYSPRLRRDGEHAFSGPIQTFIWKFDLGHYPDLIMR